MKYEENIEQVAALQPDYLGFIFWEPSKRYFASEIPVVPERIKKVGVFVDAKIEEIMEKVETYDLQGVQLHGTESPEFCAVLEQHLKQARVKIIKVFSVKEDFDFGLLEAYEDVCDYYMFDTKGKLPGGNGYAFNWEVLKAYPSTKPFFLSGGIGLESKEKITDFLKTPMARYCHAIDVNSRFEIEPGLKNIELLKKFKANFDA